MSEDTPKTSDWTEADLDLVVGDYFVMLAKDLAGRPVDPASHQRALRFVSGRSGAAIDWKQCEVSAALTLIGLPILRGVAPRWNLGDDVLDAVDRQLSARPALITAALRPDVLFSTHQPLVLTEAPPPSFAPEQIQPSPRAERLIAKFNPAGRDFADSLLTEAGRAAVLAFEQRGLRERGRGDLADQLRLTRPVQDPPGYDLESFKPTGERRLIVVKTTTGGAGTPMQLTDDEDALWSSHPDIYRLYRLYDLGRELRFYTLRPPRAAEAEGAAKVAV